MSEPCEKQLEMMRLWLEKLASNDFASATLLTGDPLLRPIAGEMNLIADRMRDTQERLKKGHALNIRYEVAARAMDFRDLDDLLTRSLHILRNVAQADAGLVWLVDHEEKLRVAAASGIREERLMGQRAEPLRRALTDPALRSEKIQIIDDAQLLDQVLTESRGADYSMMCIPLKVRGKALGVFNLFVLKGSVEEDGNLNDLLEGVTRHLAIGVENARIMDIRMQKVIQEERLQLAHELHDSLAQSIASLRFQIRVLDQTLQIGDEPGIWHEMERIEESIETANQELRELIAHFRGASHKRNIVSAIQELLDRFHTINGIQVFLQKEWHPVLLPREKEIQMYRIAQEALSNIRKHAQANMVRILMRSNPAGHIHMMIEDDGVGIRFREMDDFSEHFGMKIMQERASKLGGTLKIESEPDEGTRIILDFEHDEYNDPDAGRKTTI